MFQLARCALDSHRTPPGGVSAFFFRQKYLKVFRGGGAALSAEISLDLVPFLYLLLYLLFRRNHPGGWLEAFTAVPAVNRVHDVLHLRPSAAFHEASTRTRANTIPEAFARSPTPSLCGGGCGGGLCGARVYPALDGVEEGLLHPVFRSGELFGAHSDESQGAGCRLPYYDFICSQGFQRQGGDLHTGVHGHV